MNNISLADMGKEDSNAENTVAEMDEEFSRQIEDEIGKTDGEFVEGPEFEGSVGRTMYDTPSSKDNTVTVLLPPQNIGKLPSQALARIRSRGKDKGGDGRDYLGIVVEGPFAEPDGLRADAPIVVTTTVRGATFMPRYHGRVQVQILGQEVDGILEPPRFRPLPNSPVFVIDENETRNILGLLNDMDLGYAVGFEDMKVQIPSKQKSVLPRHVGILGTTGGGKSTTVSGLISQFSSSKLCTVVIDTEGEYTAINQPTQDQTMTKLLHRANLEPKGVEELYVLHLVGRSTTASKDEGAKIRSFSLEFSSLSPYAVAEILDLTDAQIDRFFKTYDTSKLILRDLGVFPQKNNSSDENAILELNEFETGYPKMTLLHLIDIASFILNHLSHTDYEPYTHLFKDEKAKKQINQRIASLQTNNEISWKALLGKIWRLYRMEIFDNPKATPIRFDTLISAGRTLIIDLSDTDSTIVNNLVISNILREIQQTQERVYSEATKNQSTITPVMIIIEEAHEFLSRERITKMQNLFEQVARIARRGRKRWIGLVFVTQLPQHLPDEVLGLINNYILHKITDANVIARLKRSIGGIDDSLWNRLPNLAPGQAIVSMMSMTRPLLVAINPTPCMLRMID
jgi:uncharacterized protein